jgi:hypothetical protein
MKGTENAVWNMVEHSYTGNLFGLEIKCLFLFIVQIQFRTLD